MKSGLYPRLAWDGLRKNRQLTWPYLLTCVSMVAMHYILAFLASPTALSALPQGSETIQTIMVLGCAVVLIFSVIFLFYTYSFLNRRRSKEFGLYNVLGMGRRNLARIVLWECAITAAVALVGGLALGAALSKLAQLGLVNLMDGDIDYRLTPDLNAVVRTITCFIPVFAINGLAAVIRTQRGSAVSLLKAENIGEKPPRGNALLALLGVAILGAAYWIAIRIKSPIDALGWFFVAVLMVIVATYMLLIAGSVWLCRRLQKNKRYYYRADHFVSVSSMAFRMKRNGAGLASICVIATMVLVMMSTTTCLMMGMEESIQTRYPRDINLEVSVNEIAQLDDANLDIFRQAVAELAREKNVGFGDIQDFRFINLFGIVEDNVVQCDYETASGKPNYSRLREINLVSADDYASKTGKEARLDAGEVLLLVDGCEYASDTLTLKMGENERVYRVKAVENGKLVQTDTGRITPSIDVVVPDLGWAIEGLARMGRSGSDLLIMRWKYGFDTDLDDEGTADFEYELHWRLNDALANGAQCRGFDLNTRAEGEVNARNIYGGLFFIGLVLSLVFLLAAVLIIYYKQVSEGYEDAKRFEIMQKVGMTKREIRRSIASQLLIVFMLPLALAALHLAFAFPMIQKLLILLGLSNIGLFIRTTLISLAGFAAFYWIVYRMTSGVYYRIVSHTGLDDLVQ